MTFYSVVTFVENLDGNVITLQTLKHGNDTLLASHKAIFINNNTIYMKHVINLAYTYSPDITGLK